MFLDFPAGAGARAWYRGCRLNKISRGGAYCWPYSINIYTVAKFKPWNWYLYVPTFLDFPAGADSRARYRGYRLFKFSRSGAYCWSYSINIYTVANLLVLVCADVFEFSHRCWAWYQGTVPAFFIFSCKRLVIFLIMFNKYWHYEPLHIFGQTQVSMANHRWE